MSDDDDIWLEYTKNIDKITNRNKLLFPKLEKKYIDIQRKPDLPKTDNKKTYPQLSVGKIVDLDKNTAKKIISGKFNIDAKLDLHGHTRESAYAILKDFIEDSVRKNFRYLLVVTGKGQGILKDKVPRWLNELEFRDKILFFCHAKQNHGGEGALYILLKNFK